MSALLSLPAHAELTSLLGGAEPTLVHLVGPAGSGKSLLLSRVLAERPQALHWVLPPLEEAGLLADLDTLVAASLGPLPLVERPDILPLRGSGLEWAKRFEGVFEVLARGGEGSYPAGTDAPAPAPLPGVLAVDGAELLAGAGRRGMEALAEGWTRARERGLSVHLVLSWREAPGESGPLARLAGTWLPVGRPPFREAGWWQGEGGESGESGFPRALQALLSWTYFGDHPARLRPRRMRPSPAPRTPEEAILERVLLPGGDLHDRPLQELEARFQSPRRYAEILTALASGANTWGAMARAVGQGAGNTLAPYLARLEAAGWIRVEAPLDGAPGGRRRRYALVDPFHHFWFGRVLPLRSLLRREDPEAILRSAIEPHLPAHAAAWLPELTRRWLHQHASERLPAAAREVGALWADGVEIPVAAGLRGGQIVYGICHPGPGGPTRDVELLVRLEEAMRDVRWGLGRETRIPLVVLLSPPSPELVRLVARTGIGLILTPLELFPPDGAPSSFSAEPGSRP